MERKRFWIINGRIEFEVKEIIDHLILNHQPFFKIKWIVNTHPTWEPLSHLSCPQLLKLYAQKSEGLLNELSRSGLNKIVNGILESTWPPETAHSRTLEQSFSGSWINVEPGTKSSTSLSEESKLEQIQAKMILKGFTYMPPSSCLPQTPGGRLSTTYVFQSTPTVNNATITSLNETLLRASRDGGTTTPKRPQKSMKKSSRWNGESPQGICQPASQERRAWKTKTG